jgi:hypothetical protein
LLPLLIGQVTSSHRLYPLHSCREYNYPFKVCKQTLV